MCSALKPVHADWDRGYTVRCRCTWIAVLECVRDGNFITRSRECKQTLFDERNTSLLGWKHKPTKRITDLFARCFIRKPIDQYLLYTILCDTFHSRMFILHEGQDRKRPFWVYKRNLTRNYFVTSSRWKNDPYCRTSATGALRG